LSRLNKTIRLRNKAWGFIPQAFACLSFVTALAGCGASDEVAPPPSPLSSQTETQAKTIEASFEKAVLASDLNGIKQLGTDKLTKKLPKEFSEWAKGPFAPFSKTSNWAIDTVASPNAGRKVVAHIHFTGPDNETYRTNLVMEGSGSDLKLDSVVPPSKGSVAEHAVGGSFQKPP